MKRYYVYILRCADGKYYVGMTNNVDRRVAEHSEQKDLTAWTYGRGPFELVYVQDFQWVQDAIAWEKQLKGWTVRKKEALMEANYEALRAYAKCENATRHDRPEREEPE